MIDIKIGGGDMKEMYSIGEIAKLMGLSVQTIRYYSNIGLITPCFVNPETGYRFYDAKSFSPLDRAKYFQKLGFTLAEVKEMYEKNDVGYVIDRLNVHAKQMEESIRRQQLLLDELIWYSKVFSHKTSENILNKPYIRYFPARFAFAVNRFPGESPARGNARLYLKKNGNAFRKLEYRRQNMILYNSDEFFSGELSPFKYGFYLRELPNFESNYFLTFQAGYYICFQTRVLTGDWTSDIFCHFFKNVARPPYVIADEYEDDLFRFKQSVYEIQLYFDQPQKE